MDVKDFELLGLNHNEAIVYLALVELGRASAGELIKRTAFHRNIVYDNLNKLVDKGLVTFIDEEGIRFFQPMPPESILDMLEKKSEEINKQQVLAKKILPEVKKLLKLQELKQEAGLYRGVKAIKYLFNDIIKEGEDYVVYGAPQASIDIMGGYFWKNYNKRAVEKKIRARMIFNSEIRKWGKLTTNRYTRIRYLPKEFDNLTETSVYKDKVSIVVWSQKPIGVLIKDKNVADAYRAYFEILWKQAKK